MDAMMKPIPAIWRTVGDDGMTVDAMTVGEETHDAMTDESHDVNPSYDRRCYE